MRKIMTKDEKDRKIRRNQIIIGVILIGVMVFGTLGYAFSGKDEENSEKIEYKGVEFIQDSSGYWRFNIQRYDFSTKYNPRETEDIPFFTYTSINNYVNKPLYLVSEFNEPNFEISRNLNALVLRMQKACLPEQDCLDNLPIKNCSIDNIIIIKELENEQETENIHKEENCVYITASFQNQTRYADTFLFKILGL